MFLEGCLLPQFGCSVLLRGGNQSELSRLKRVARHLVFCRYHWRLELSYLMDEFAQPPSITNDSFFEEPTSSDQLVHQNSQSKLNQKLNVDQSVSLKSRRRNSSDQPDTTKRVTAESIIDFSDPLHQYLTLGEEANNVQGNGAQCLAVAKIPYLNQFRKALDDTILSVSPYLKVLFKFSIYFHIYIKITRLTIFFIAVHCALFGN